MSLPEFITLSTYTLEIEDTTFKSVGLCKCCQKDNTLMEALLFNSDKTVGIKTLICMDCVEQSKRSVLTFGAISFNNEHGTLFAMRQVYSDD